MDSNESIFIAGHNGLVGSALVRAFKRHGFSNLLVRDHAELDLTDQRAVRAFFSEQRPTRVVVAAGRVGGILANNERRAEFIFDNLMISANIIDAASRCDAVKVLNLGSSCIYPRDCPQPMREEYLLTGPLEGTNEPYAIAKIAAIKLIESYYRQYGCNFLSAMPTNLYGPHDNFDLMSSHVLPAMLRKFHEATLAGHGPVTLWGSGNVRREFLHVDDIAEACVFIMEHISAEQVPGSLINVGCGSDLTIRELAGIIQRVTGHHGEIRWDASKPDGTPRKLLDVSRLQSLGWRSSIPLEDGIASTYRWFAGNSLPPAQKSTAEMPAFMR
jgi:GDP-L-fucose synthase